MELIHQERGGECLHPWAHVLVLNNEGSCTLITEPFVPHPLRWWQVANHSTEED